MSFKNSEFEKIITKRKKEVKITNAEIAEYLCCDESTVSRKFHYLSSGTRSSVFPAPDFLLAVLAILNFDTYTGRQLFTALGIIIDAPIDHPFFKCAQEIIKMHKMSLDEKIEKIREFGFDLPKI